MLSVFKETKTEMYILVNPVNCTFLSSTLAVSWLPVVLILELHQLVHVDHQRSNEKPNGPSS